MAYELSYGDGITRGTYIAGVSIASACNGVTKKEYELSQCFVSDKSFGEALEAAREYVVKLQGIT